MTMKLSKIYTHRKFLLWLLPLLFIPGIASSDTEAPVILSGGYGQSNLVAGVGGPLHILAWVNTYGVEDDAYVEVFINGQPTGIRLHDDGLDGDTQAGDNWYTYFIPDVGPGVQAGRYLLELAAFDHAGNQSDLWPYFEIKAGFYSPLPPLMTACEQNWQNAYQAALRVSGTRPRIRYGGYLNSILSEQGGGFMTLINKVEDPDWDVSSVPLLLSGMQSGIRLQDDGSSGDFRPNDGTYGFAQFFLPPLNTTGPFILEVYAEDSAGNKSDIWPYLWVNTPTPTATPTVTPTPTITPTNPPTSTPTTTPTATPSPCFEIYPQPPVQVVGEYVHVDASCSPVWGGFYLEYSWDWGDGTQTGWSTHPTEKHIYTKAKDEPYPITLIIRTESGHTASLTKYVNIVP